jgi:UDP-N-acetylmuramoyl-tripeptide--D-alanyl-D-alanine ligase
LSAAEIAARSGGDVIAGSPAAEVSSWAFDTRVLADGACFVALSGVRDGHDFVGEAWRAGARVVLVDRPVPLPDGAPDHAVVRVPDVLAGLQGVARTVRQERADLRVLAVAGSTGKTSTKDLLAAVMPGESYASPQSYNNEFGLPITLLNAPAAAHMVVAEMGERFPGDVAKLCAIAQPQSGIVTNVGLAHAEHLGGPEGVAAVLAELLVALPPRGLAVLNADDPWTPRLAAHSAATVETVGCSASADHRISNVEVDGALRPAFTLAGCRFRLAMRGAHQVLNAALAAVAANRTLGVPWSDVAARMAAVEGSRWRMELTETAGGLIVLNDSYNANPSSMSAALHALARMDVSGRRIAVLGDMRELGTHGASAHEEVGALVAALGIDALVGVGAGGREIAIAVEAHGANTEVRTVPDAEAAGRVVLELAEAGDAVLVKASRALGLEAVAERLLHPRTVHRGTGHRGSLQPEQPA